MKKIKIAPSILSADFANLSRDINMVTAADCVDRIHLDVMDGHFVPNITFGPPLVKSIRGVTKLKLESHLMIADPEKYIEPFIKAGSDIVIIHYEAVQDKNKIIQLLSSIKQKGVLAGISINPSTDWEVLKDVLVYCDLVLVMTVNPGFGGQAFIDDVLVKMKNLAEYIKENKLDIEIEVDGGINIKTAKLAVAAGADVLVAGSSVFNTDDPITAIKNIQESIECRE